jgi:hypothetical protein
LPKENLTSDDLRRKTEYEIQLSATEGRQQIKIDYQAEMAGSRPDQADTSFMPKSLKDMPWIRAMMMIPELVSHRDQMRKAA